MRVLASFALRKTPAQDRADLHRPLPRHQTLRRTGPAHAGAARFAVAQTQAHQPPAARAGRARLGRLARPDSRAARGSSQVRPARTAFPQGRPAAAPAGIAVDDGRPVADRAPGACRPGQGPAHGGPAFRRCPAEARSAALHGRPLLLVGGARPDRGAAAARRGQRRHASRRLASPGAATDADRAGPAGRQARLAGAAAAGALGRRHSGRDRARRTGAGTRGSQARDLGLE